MTPTMIDQLFNESSQKEHVLNFLETLGAAATAVRARKAEWKKGDKPLSLSEELFIAADDAGAAIEDDDACNRLYDTGGLQDRIVCQIIKEVTAITTV